MGKRIALRESFALTESLLSSHELESELQDADKKESTAVESAEHVDDSSIYASNAARKKRLLKELDGSFYHYARWATLDVLLQNLLQRTALSFFKMTFEEEQLDFSDAKLEAEEETSASRRHCCRRPHGRYTPLHRAGELKMVYAIQSGLSFFQKLIFRSLNAFIATVLVYRSSRYLSGAQGLEFMEFEQLFSDPEQDGIDTLVRLLADLDSDALLYVLASFPFVLGMLRGALASVTAKGLTEDAQRDLLLYRTAKVSEQSFLRDAIIPLFPRGFSGQMGEVGTALCWDGRITSEPRQTLLRILQDVAKQGHYVTQIVAMRELSYIAHGGGERDLQTVSAELSEAVLAQRQGALQTLQHLYSQGISSGRYYWPHNLVQHVYAAYLLWWLGLSPSRWLSSGFFLFKAGKLTLQVLLIGKIIQSIDAVLRCRHRRFEFGSGYVYGSDLFSLQCFLKRLELFRLLDKKESVAEFVKTFTQYDLRDLTEIDLSHKKISNDEFYSILDGLITQGVEKNIKKLVFSGRGYSGGRILFSYPLGRLSSLEYLSLFADLLHPCSLHNLNKLRTLELIVPGKMDWTANMLKDLQELRKLSLDISTTKLTENFLFSLINLTELEFNIMVPSLVHFPNNLLQKNTFLEKISLIIADNLDMHFLPQALFAYNSQLTFIKISVSPEFQWDLQLFSFKQELKVIEMQGGKLAPASTILSPLRSLSRLYLFDVAFQGKFPEDFFRGVHLSELILNQCQISDLPMKLFQPLIHLEKISLSRNQLEFIDFVCSLSSTLRILDISHNRIKSFPVNSSTCFPENLERVYFDNNPFIPTVLNRMFLSHLPSSIRYLVIHRGGVNAVNKINADALYDLPKLEFIDIEGTFRELPAEMFNRNSKLVNISISSPYLLSLPSAIFSSQKRLRQIALDSDSLQSLPSKLFSSLVNLKTLEIIANHTLQLTTDHFKYINQLENLFINGGKDFPLEVLSQLTQLESFTIDDSSVVTFSDNPHISVSLREINFVHCGLTDEQLASLINHFPPNLRSLSLRENHITSRSVESLKKTLTYNLESFSLDYNHIDSRGIKLLQAVLPCSQLRFFGLDGNPGYTDQGQQRMNLTVQNSLLRAVCEDERCLALKPIESCEKRSNQEILKSIFSSNQHHAPIGFFCARHNHHHRAPTPLPNVAYSTSAYVGSMWVLWPTVTMGLLLVLACMLYLRNRVARQPQKRQIITRETVITSGDIDPQDEVQKPLDHEFPYETACGSKLTTVNHSLLDVVGVRL